MRVKMPLIVSYLCFRFSLSSSLSLSFSSSVHSFFDTIMVREIGIHWTDVWESIPLCLAIYLIVYAMKLFLTDSPRPVHKSIAD